MYVLYIYYVARYTFGKYFCEHVQVTKLATQVLPSEGEKQYSAMQCKLCQNDGKIQE